MVALQALADYAAAVYSPEQNINVIVSNGETEHNFKVNAINALVYQTYRVGTIRVHHFVNIA